jgi:hypothetical protein
LGVAGWFTESFPDNIFIKYKSAIPHESDHALQNRFFDRSKIFGTSDNFVRKSAMDEFDAYLYGLLYRKNNSYFSNNSDFSGLIDEVLWGTRASTSSYLKYYGKKLP